MMSDITDRWRAFQEWQQQPYQVAPKSAEMHRCATCGEEYQGNYCPRCGQSARIGRYSLKKALLLFLDVWGLGNRGMFRTLRDLLLRPGYMIRDYISGMQMAYFPPFKLLFLLVALEMVVASGYNLKDMRFLVSAATEQAMPAAADSAAKEEAEGASAKEEPKEKDFATAGHWVGNFLDEFSEKYPNVGRLLILLFMSVFIYFSVRKSPAVPDLRFSELFVAMVYSLDMITIYIVVFSFFGLSSDAYVYALLLFFIIPLKQLTGFKWWRTTLLILLSYLYAVILIALVVIASYFIMGG